MTDGLKRLGVQLSAITLLTLGYWGYQYSQAEPSTLPAQTHYALCFSPDGNCETKLLHLIRNAKHSIYIQSYSFTSRKIANALKNSAKRGVIIKAIVDRSLFDPDNHYSRIKTLMRVGIPVWVDYRVNIQHNKVMIIDQETVETGSYNFTVSANQRNAENMLIIQDAGLVKRYLHYWHERQKLAKPAKQYHFKRRRFH